MQQRAAILLDFFAMLDDEGVTYCVMGDTHEFPDIIASDVDIVVPECKVKDLPKLVADFCDYRELLLAQCLQHEHNAYYFVIAFTNSSGRHEFLALDLCGNYFRRGRYLLSAAELHENLRAVTDAAGSEVR